MNIYIEDFELAGLLAALATRGADLKAKRNAAGNEHLVRFEAAYQTTLLANSRLINKLHNEQQRRYKVNARKRFIGELGRLPVAEADHDV